MSLKSVLVIFGSRQIARRLSACLLVMMFSVLAHAEFQNETLRYVVTYKWGVIHKDAGDAVLRLKNSGGKYNIVLTARSKPWADKIYSVRDTLRATILKSPLRPLRYEKAAKEAGKYKKDVITYAYSGNKTIANAVRSKVTSKERKTLKKTFTAHDTAYDFISIFYYLRALDYSSLRPGTIIKKTVFSGSKSELIIIKCRGRQVITLRDKTKADTWHISFRFTTEGGKKSSDDINVWMSTGNTHIPLLLEGSLPVGKIRCQYLGD